MKFPIDIKKRLYGAIVPILCGSNRGTAFFINENTLLTARHILADNAVNNDDVTIKIGNKLVKCIVEPIAKEEEPIDVVLLRTERYKHGYWLPLLAAVFNEERDLCIMGYPREIVNGEDIICIDVHDRIGTTRQDFDTAVVRTDPLALDSYKGFSGSPVLNEMGSVIGVTLQQLYGGLGYRSMNSIKDRLKNHGVDVSEDWQSEDFSPLGRGTSQRQVNKAIGYAALRYNPDLHVANQEIDDKIDLFAIREVQTALFSRLAEIERKALSIAYIRTRLSNYHKGDYDDLYYQLEGIRDGYDDGNGNSKKKYPERFFQEEYPLLGNDIGLIHYCKTKLLIVNAEAGMGKTHYMCATAQRLSQRMNVYLLFGSRFNSQEDFEHQLTRMAGMENKSLEDLDEAMEEQHSNALIIIDAINEGATNIFWNIALKNLELKIKELRNLRVIVTYREGDLESSDVIGKYPQMTMEGYGLQVQEAIQKYFAHYKIEDEDKSIRERFLREFKNPLFLNIFCQVLSHDLSLLKYDFSYIELYRKYIGYRNIAVSDGVDEDSHRNVTIKLLNKIAMYSLFYNSCQDIPREKARHYADHICRYRTWRKSLLYWTIKENLLLETGMDGERLMFGFQKIGDFLMADAFCKSKMEDEAKIDYVIEKSECKEYGLFRRFLTALLSEWSLMPKLLERNLFVHNNLMNILFDSLNYRTSNNELVFKWMIDQQAFSLGILHNLFKLLPEEVFMMAHERLMCEPLTERDRKWTIAVNNIYNSFMPENVDDYIRIEITEKDYRKYLILLGWMCTSTHPFIRGRLLRHLVALFDKAPELSQEALRLFSSCNDMYVTEMIVCAIYGHLLRHRDKEKCTAVAELILKIFYSNGHAPADILVRQWTMLIFQYADYLSGNSSYWQQVQIQFQSIDPFSLINKPLEKNKDYFGMSDGSKRLYETLCGFSDFNRYILGSNYDSVSSVFCKKDGEDYIPVPLQDIRDIMANIIMDEYGWNDKLGNLDKGIYSNSRYDNKTERFGKKYLWMALHKTDALLCDHCSVLKERHYGADFPTKEEIADLPYPWLTREYSTIDPTTLTEREEDVVDFITNGIEDAAGIDNEKWMEESYPMPVPRLKLTDYEGGEWIVLTCYDGHTTAGANDTVKDLFLYSNAGFVKKEQLDAYKEWAKKQNFYGRWMPECRNGSIEYLWNEYPWAETYKRNQDEWEIEHIHEGEGFSLLLSYEAQLQKNWFGLDESKAWLHEVCMPNHHIMDHLRLYTAERGVVRACSNNEIVSVNIRIDRLRGMVIRKEYLDKYLTDMGYSLVYYSLGEKLVRSKDSYHNLGNNYDLSGVYSYEDGNIVEVQPMYISNIFPKTYKDVLNDDDIKEVKDFFDMPLE